MISDEKHIIFATVELGTKVEDIIRDALIKIGKDIILIEITVTHKTSEEKIRKAKKYGLSILDIDLIDYDRAFNLEDLVEEVIYNTRGSLHGTGVTKHVMCLQKHNISRRGK
ncbi:hypothetical protein [Cytobacillus horneckiae]|uniref:hypothetical protein n=1 Tax=Cytobacillus horneckiae TaxID=549687 RepID=UPI003D9A913B